MRETNSISTLFESLVNSDRSQTVICSGIRQRGFESLVNSDRSQTVLNGEDKDA